MSARLIRIKKEVRALFWPWCAVVIGGASPLILPHSYAEHVSAGSFFMGIPLLATLSIGHEFRHRTMSLWLAQPASRMQLWGEKMIVMCPAVLSAGWVCGIVMFSFMWPQLEATHRVAAIAYVVIAMASATFWTLSVRSTLGGFIVIGCILLLGDLFAGEVANLPRPGEEFRAIPAPTAAITIISAFTICFAGVMLWLGARKLARFQVTGGADEDLLTAGPLVMPQALAELFRSRPSGALSNLIRKEFRLLRPLWLMALIMVLYVAFLVTFRLFPVPPPEGPHTLVEWVVLGPFASLVGMAGLAGILSLGEERASGTYTWHMTLPVSARRQWVIKLIMAMVAGVTCAVVFPYLTMVAGGTVFGSPLMFVNIRAFFAWLFMAPVLTFACFWCACAANGTVRAAIWVFPATTAIFLARPGGTWLGEELARSTGTLKDLIVSSFYLSPLAFTGITDFLRGGVLWAFVPALVVGVFQSYRLFRTQPQDSALWMLRCLMPLVAVTILWTFSASFGFASSRWEPFDETRQALDKLHAGATYPELSGEDLAKGASLTALTQHWLKGSSITVTRDHSRLPGYLATIHLANGLECRLTVAQSGGTAASCGNLRRQAGHD